jgi:hypothetical protein
MLKLLRLAGIQILAAIASALRRPMILVIVECGVLLPAKALVSTRHTLLQQLKTSLRFLMVLA